MKCYMATFQPAYRTTELVFPTQVRVYAATRKEAKSAVEGWRHQGAMACGQDAFEGNSPLTKRRLRCDQQRERPYCNPEQRRTR